MGKNIGAVAQGVARKAPRRIRISHGMERDLKCSRSLRAAFEPAAPRMQYNALLRSRRRVLDYFPMNF
jgi:hypothetical protein